MKKIFKLFIISFIFLSIEIQAETVNPAVSDLFNWAEDTFPSFFPVDNAGPPLVHNQTLFSGPEGQFEWEYRAYQLPNNKGINYVGINSGHGVYVLGPSFTPPSEVIFVGTIESLGFSVLENKGDSSPFFCRIVGPLQISRRL
jgi:hypothetical protein